ncbi:hypothetical protein Leryth_011769 [Lithospermum erythrorhizon]|nr:hypothetical protein Leryth_011769 [Lithospermum erythrorhizon]
MSALPSCFISSTTLSGSPLGTVDRGNVGIVYPHSSLSLRNAKKSSISRRPLTVQADYSGGRGSNDAGAFVGGFILGGLIVGTLGCVFAPQVSKALAGTDKKEIMRKLPKFIYDEEKALEKQRKKLSEKIEQLNTAIDEISNQLRSEDNPNGAAVNTDDVESFA